MSRYLSMRNLLPGGAEGQKLVGEMLASGKPMVIGQIVGHVTGAEEKDVVQKDGSTGKSIICYGSFELISTKTGEVKESGACYFPAYFARELLNAFKSQKGGNILIGVEVSIEPSGRAIPYQYELKNVTGFRRSAPLEALKAAMANAGTLKIPFAGPAPTIETLSHDVAVPSIGYDDHAADAEDGAPAEEGEQKKVAKHKKAA